MKGFPNKYIMLAFIAAMAASCRLIAPGGATAGQPAAMGLLPILPEDFLERLRLKSVRIDTTPATFIKVDGGPAILTSAGPFRLMDETSIANRKWIAPLGPFPILDVAQTYASYINSDAFLKNIAPSKLDGLIPPNHLFHKANMAVRNQGPSRQTCVAHASLAGMEMRAGVPDNLSQQYAHHWFLRHLKAPTTCCDSNNRGVFVIDAGNDLVGVGIPTADSSTEREYTTEMPACSDSFNCSVPHHDSVMEVVSPRWCISGIGEIPGGNTGAAIGNVGYLEALITAGYDVVLAFEVNFWDKEDPDGSDPNGIIQVVMMGHQPMHSRAYHAVLITGYDRDHQYFVARNSFGPKWGHHGGDAYLSYNYISTYSVAGYIIRSVVKEMDPTSPLAVNNVSNEPSVPPKNVRQETLPPIPALLPLPTRREVVAEFCAEPGQVAVSKSGRVFVSFPRATDSPDHAVVEVKDGKHIPYPNAWIQRPREGDMQREAFMAVRGLTVDPHERLWVLDSGCLQMRASSFGGPKLIGIDLDTNAIIKEILLPKEVAPSTSYLSDVRVAQRGEREIAFIADAGPGDGIVVVDLANGRSWRRRLSDSRVTNTGSRQSTGGLALSPDNRLLYYRPYPSAHLFAINVDALSDPTRGDEDIAGSIVDIGELPPSNGFETDETGILYTADYPGHSVRYSRIAQPLETETEHLRASPTSVAISKDGMLYVLMKASPSSSLLREALH
jgi:sugar lactone lactonase YvrE